MVEVNRVAPLSDYAGQSFDLVLLATKAQAAIELAPKLIPLLASGGTLLPIQNGSVPQLLAEQVGEEYVLGGLSNLGATMIAHGVYEQRNAGHILIGELRGGNSERTIAVEQWLSQGISVRTTRNLRGSMWSKLLLNCSVTTIGAVLGCTMREYVQLPLGRDVFEKTYSEALNVVLALGEQPETMLVEPIPPSRTGSVNTSQAYNSWFQKILDNYGDTKLRCFRILSVAARLKSSLLTAMLSDLGSRTESTFYSMKLLLRSLRQSLAEIPIPQRIT